MIIENLKLVLALIDDSKVEKVFMDAADLLLSVRLGKFKKGVTLDQVISRIEGHVVEEADPTQILREMRDRSYDY